MHEDRDDESYKNVELGWRHFRTRHRRSYLSKIEEFFRRRVFARNRRFVNAHNLRADKGLESFRLELNSLSDLTFNEFKKISATHIPIETANLVKHLVHIKRKKGSKYSNLPSNVDLRERGFVTGVKDQTQICGSCWAFAAIGALEGHLFRKNGTLVSLSEQYLIDCSGQYGNKGCDGGSAINAFKFLKDYGFNPSEKSYPYKGKTGKCSIDLKNKREKRIDFKVIPNKDEKAMQLFIANIGPLAVRYVATSRTMQFFSSRSFDIFEDSKCNNDPKAVGHAVLIVGYGTIDGKDYWLIKNSWGEKWGDKGYFRMARNKNMCGIATYPSYPIFLAQ